MRYLMAVVLLAGCSVLSPCKDEPINMDVEWGSVFEEFEQSIVNSARENGYSCESKSLRNAFGTQIGTSYHCTKC
jgi:hypothetical protein